MTKKTPANVKISRTEAIEEQAPSQAPSRKRGTSPLLWLWFTIVIVTGVIIISVINSTITSLFAIGNTPTNPAANTIEASSSLLVLRTSQYASLQITLLNAQSAPSFPDDSIHPGAATVRLSLRVMNITRVPVATVYYDCAHLLISQKDLIALSNTSLSSELASGKSQVGWLDFPVSRHVDLKALALQFGSTALDETMVTIPLIGPFDPGHFITRSSRQSLAISYVFSGNQLIYHLKQVDVLYSYQGSQAKAGQQFYVLNFLVDNPNSAVSPGLGFDYVRLVVNGYDQPPLDSTLPYTFNAGTHATTGVVVFAAPAHMRTITIAFRTQMGDAQQSYVVHI